jgi:hypothetical protein
MKRSGRLSDDGSLPGLHTVRRTPLAFALVLAIASAIPGRTAGAQALAEVRPNARIKVATTNGLLHIGRVNVIRGDTLWLQDERSDTVAVFPAASLSEYDLSFGRNRWRGARRGALVAGTISLVGAGFGLHEARKSNDADFVSPILVAATLGVMFTLVGSGVGALLEQERWSGPRAVQLGIAPTGSGRVQLRYQLRF